MNISLVLDRRRVFFDQEDLMHAGMLIMLGAAFMLLCISGAGFATVLHANGDTLTDLFYTQAFTGSWEWFSKVNFLGKLMNGIISIFSFLGLFLTVARVLITMLYLSNCNLFDTINDLKSHGKGQSAFGFMGMMKEVYSANYGVGLDAFFGFFLSLFPNVKAYSDYADGKMGYNLAEDDTITTYLLKISLPTIMTIFVFTIGFSGVLWQAFGNVVGALNVAMESLVNIQLDQYMNRALNTGSNYSFGYSADGTQFGKFQQNIAKNVYNKVLSKTVDLTSEKKLDIGQKVDSLIAQHVSAANIKSSCDVDVLAGDREADKLQYSVVMNSQDKYESQGGKALVLNWSPSDLGLDSNSDASKNLYVHVFISKKASTDETNYFEFNQNSKSGSSDNKPSASTGEAVTQ